jgi:hypothetical protein
MVVEQLKIDLHFKLQIFESPLYQILTKTNECLKELIEKGKIENKNLLSDLRNIIECEKFKAIIEI